MKDRVNTYLAALLITIAGASAALFIVHIATKKTPIIKAGSEESYSALKDSILKSN